MRCQSPVTITVDGKPVKVPCGKCIFCCEAKAKDWEFRLKKHFTISEYLTYFITLTYEDDNLSFLPLSLAKDERLQKRRQFQYQYWDCIPFKNNEAYQKHLIPFKDLNSIEGVPSLVPDDLKNFIKRLRININRNYAKVKTSFFAIGEYGPTTFRPHYHIIFGINRSDYSSGPRKLQGYSSTTGRETIFYTPDQIISYLVSKSWQQGYTTVSPITDTRIAYCSRYTFKFPSASISRYFKECPGLLKPFARMSKGIGKSFVEANKYSLPGRTTVTQGSIVYRVPRYFRRKLLEDYLDADQSLAMIERYKRNEDDEIQEVQRFYSQYCRTFHLAYEPTMENLANLDFQNWLQDSRIEKQEQIKKLMTKHRKL